MTDHQIALRSLLALGAFWLIIYYCVKPLLLDAFRHELFIIRDQLFDYAAEGKVAFNSPAYVRMRGMINSMIRFAHRISLVRVLLIAISVLTPKVAKEFMNERLEPINALPERDKIVFLKIHGRVLNSTTAYLVKRTPFLWIVILVFTFCAFMAAIWRGTIQKIGEIMTLFALWLPGIVSMEAHAIDCDNN